MRAEGGSHGAGKVSNSFAPIQTHALVAHVHADLDCRLCREGLQGCSLSDGRIYEEGSVKESAERVMWTESKEAAQS